MKNASRVQSDLNLKEQLLRASSPSAAAEIVTRLSNQMTRDTPVLLQLNASHVGAFGLGPRHGASFVTRAFADLKESIRSTNGNQQPILIQVINEKLVIVFGHRRHKACLDLSLPVLAMVWAYGLTEAEAFAHLERENEFRTSLSPFEKGCLFKALVSQKIFSSFRALADHIHMSHAGVNAVVKVANLHEIVIKAFGDPCTITTKYADEIGKAWDSGSASILLRTRELCDRPPQKRLPPKKILEYLLSLVPETPTSTPLVMGKPHLGSWEKTKDGQVLVRLPPSSTTTIIDDIGRLVQLADAHNEIQSENSIAQPFSGNPVSTDPADHAL
jgi:ParB family chromosome partitioning protein